MTRRIICLIAIVCVVLAGCGVLKPGKSFEKVGRRLLKLSDYTCDVTMKVTNNRSTNTYRMKHFYKSPDKYRVEVVEPEELKGQVTIYNGSSSYIFHPGINQYLETENFNGSVEYNSFIGSFIEYIRKSENIKISSENTKDGELIVLEFEVQKPNRYMRTEKLWLDPERAVPLRAEIYGDDGRTSVEIFYDNFVYNPGLKDGDFEITK